MFVLRRISGTGIEINQAIGNSYTIISKKHNQEEFERCHQKYFDNPPTPDPDGPDTKGLADMATAFISGDIGVMNLQPIYPWQDNFIMNENGGTFCNLKNY